MRGAFKWIAIAVAVVAAVAILGGATFIGDERQDDMSQARAEPAAREVPPIDLEAPAKTETATFALG